MPPRPSSQTEPSSRRAISKSPKINEIGSVLLTTDSSRAARSKQGRHSPFVFNGSPHTEQVATTDATGIAMALSLNLSLTHVATRVTLRPPQLRCPPFGAPQRAILPCNAHG